jgi:germination protein YpeB
MGNNNGTTTGGTAMTRKRTIQLLSITAAAFAAISAVAIGGWVCAGRYQQNLEYSYRRSFLDLTDYVSTIESTLEKASYANTATQQSAITAKLMQEASGAKTALSVLPLQEDTMETVEKFLSQVGDFSTALGKQIAAGSAISDEQHQMLDELYNYSALLKADLAQLEAQFSDPSTSLGQPIKLLSNLSVESDVPDFGNAISDYADDFQDYPTLIYDGPFSDHISQKTPKALENLESVTAEEAISNAADFFSLEKSAISYTSDTGGNLPTFNLTCTTKTISVTQQGGTILSLLDSRTPTETNLTYEEAKEKAEDFLQKNNLGDMTESYYVINDNLCTIQFFSTQNGVVLYPDLIKITVAMDTGDIAEYNATGYLMNHQNRSLSTPSLSLEEARKSVSSALTIESETMAVIPTAGLNEVLCYEFLCTGKGGEEVLVYINSDTGMEEQILILLRSDNGVLTR